MTDEEIIKKISEVEVRTGSERTIKSYALRNNVMDEDEQRLLLSFFPHYGVVFDSSCSFDWQTLFGNRNPVVIEIGFGMGATTEIIAEENPGVNYLGLEVYLKGFIRLLRSAGQQTLENLRLMRFNAVDVLEHMVPDGSVDGFHIFFPDPWPKKRHHKRRLIQSPFVSLLARKLKKGGYIYLATDWQEYADWMLSVLSSEPLLENKYEGFAPPMPWRPRTKFEQKGLDKDYKINEVYFIRK